MEKLQEILRAEEEALRVVRDAQERAAEIERRAVDDAVRIHAEAMTSARQDLAALRVKILRDADDEAARVTERSEREFSWLARSAEARVDEAIAIVVAEIRG